MTVAALDSKYARVPSLKFQNPVLTAFACAVWHCSSGAEVAITLNEPAGHPTWKARQLFGSLANLASGQSGHDMQRQQKITSEKCAPLAFAAFWTLLGLQMQPLDMISADRWRDDVRLSDIEPLFTCQACGQRGADVWPNFDLEQEARREVALYWPKSRQLAKDRVRADSS
jgi:hypothetical protein